MVYPPLKEKEELSYYNNSYDKTLYDDYNIIIKHQKDNTKKTKLLYCLEDECFLIKETEKDYTKIYDYLQSLGVSNIIYPKMNKYNELATMNENKYLYLFPYYRTTNNLSEKKAIDLFNELKNLHNKTAFPRKLNPAEYRSKFEEISKRLDYKFKLFEEFIRSIENNKINHETYQILENYHIVLDCKNELIRLQKRLILTIKDEETVNYSFIHNNPKNDHLIYVRGDKYLTSLDNGKIGIESLDYAKFYLENCHYNVNLKKIITEELLSYEIDFYYDYFRFLVLYVYINRIIISNDFTLTSRTFVSNTKEIDNFLKEFKDRLPNND